MFFTRAGVCAVDLTAGKVLFEDPFRPAINASVSAASPVNCGDGRFFYSASYDLGSGIWQLGGIPVQDRQRNRQFCRMELIRLFGI